MFGVKRGNEYLAVMNAGHKQWGDGEVYKIPVGDTLGPRARQIFNSQAEAFGGWGASWVRNVCRLQGGQGGNRSARPLFAEDGEEIGTYVGVGAGVRVVVCVCVCVCACVRLCNCLFPCISLRLSLSCVAPLPVSSPPSARKLTYTLPYALALASLQTSDSGEFDIHVTDGKLAVSLPKWSVAVYQFGS